MNFWTDIEAIFNNREIALLLWIAVIVLVVLLSKLRKSLVPIFKILTSKMFLIIFSLIGAYLYGTILLLKNLEVWQTSNLKDVLFWLFSVGLILVFKINEAKSNAYFKGIFLSAIKWTIGLEFIVNLYSFSLFKEIIILPILVFLAMTQAVAEMDEKHKVVSKFLQNVIAIAGLSIFSYSLYKTIVNFDDVLTFQNLVSFLLPSTITVLFIPFVYFLALYSTYESYFIHLDFMTVKKDKVKETKKLILRIANINLDKLLRIKKNFEKRVFYDDTDLKSYIHNISKQSKI
ncbi:hypothetical protein [Pleomorphovibrio marinus]|uniref:hypothetical protein n=1 Tax=Pleomorphovibrio marinus TaxID=2164132 RepID=UPI000E0C35BB|nr:hypothetical protein [Pleomorphovibrio marinus]